VGVAWTEEVEDKAARLGRHHIKKYVGSYEEEEIQTMNLL
jgi:hypothetical protein